MAITMNATVIAKGAPNRCRDGRTVMCAIVVSDEIGLARLYPLHVSSDEKIHVWSRVECKVEKTSRDPRLESFRVLTTNVTGCITDRAAKQRLLESCVLRSGNVDPIKYQNDNKRSISVVKASGHVGAELYPRETKQVDHSIDAEDAWVMCQSEFPFKPKLIWKSIQGSEHRTHVCSHEIYEGIRRNSSTPFRVFENMHIGDPDYQHWLVLGTMKDHMSNWVCAHIHRQKKTALITNTNFLTFDGKNENWPYSQQEAINAKTVDPQHTFNFTT